MRKAGSSHGTLTRPRIMGKVRSGRTAGATSRVTWINHPRLSRLPLISALPNETYFRSFASAHASPFSSLHFLAQPRFRFTSVYFTVYLTTVGLQATVSVAIVNIAINGLARQGPG